MSFTPLFKLVEVDRDKCDTISDKEWDRFRFEDKESGSDITIEIYHDEQYKSIDADIRDFHNYPIDLAYETDKCLKKLKDLEL